MDSPSFNIKNPIWGSGIFTTSLLTWVTLNPATQPDSADVLGIIRTEFPSSVSD